MLRSLDSDLPRFKTADFASGVNIAVAIRTKQARSHDSRNAVGKSNFVKVLDFLLGADARPDHVLRRPELTGAVFSLALDVDDHLVVASRSGSNPGFLDADGVKLKLGDWRQMLGSGLFSLSGRPAEPSYRSLVAFYLRDVSAGGFLDPTETHKKQSSVATLPALSYLFGLDVELAAKVTEVIEAERSLRDLRKAARDPVMGLTLGRANDLDAQIRTLQIQDQNLAARLSNFRVVEQYAEHRARVDDLSRQIRHLNDRLVLAERRLRDIEHAMRAEDEAQPDHDYLWNVYAQVGVSLPDAVTRRFEEVEAFHRSVVSNRRRYLDSERTKISQQVNADRTALGGLDAERSELMRLLEAGGALETYNELQRQLAEVQGRLTELKERRQTVDRWENGNRHLQLRSAELELQFSTDLFERREQVNSIADTYASFAYRLYGNRRPASLLIEPTRNGYRFTPTIGGDASEGVRSMSLFCFDLTMAVVALRGGRGPGFLVHDSHLYDGVEARQVAGALRLAGEICERERMQYIVTINSDDLEKTVREDPDLPYHQCLEMTDAYDDGGLFGIRFN